jgi:hypothetical protein
MEEKSVLLASVGQLHVPRWILYVVAAAPPEPGERPWHVEVARGSPGYNRISNPRTLIPLTTSLLGVFAITVALAKLLPLVLGPPESSSFCAWGNCDSYAPSQEWIPELTYAIIGAIGTFLLGFAVRLHHRME